jgi:hypothetical protein
MMTSLHELKKLKFVQEIPSKLELFFSNNFWELVLMNLEKLFMGIIYQKNYKMLPTIKKQKLNGI